MKFLYKIKLYYATGGILVRNNIVIAARREFAFMQNQSFNKICEYVRRKGGTVTLTGQFKET